MKTAYITFHVHNYGIGFTKNILGAFYEGKLEWGNMKSENLVQADLEEKVFQIGNRDKKWVFDKVYYLHVNQLTINKVTSTRANKKTDCLLRVQEDEEMNELFVDWKSILSTNKKQWNINDNELESELLKIDRDHSKSKNEILKQYWRIIHYYNFNDQVKWFFEYANSRKVYHKENFELINLEEKYKLNDLHDHKKIGTSIQHFIKDYSIIENFERIVINISSIGYEVQVAWFALAQAGYFSEKVKFISTYDYKDQNKRFKDFYIKEVPKNVIEEITDNIKIFDSSPLSEKRLIAQKELKMYINKGFSILILGERGVGKTRLIQENTRVAQEKFRSISAAAYDDDARLEAELFGYVEGAYTGAKPKGSDGLFHIVSPDGILFIDELHAMSNRVQEKLMSSLSTNKKGEFEFRRLGGDKTEIAKFTILFATNKSIDELKYKYLLPDFYDRVVQYVISIPPLKDVKEDIKEDWKKTWEHQKFSTKMKCPENKELFDFLLSIDTPGNWRDLQRIAIWYEAFYNFDLEHKKLIGFKSPIDYVKNQYEKICLRNDQKTKFNFSHELTANGQIEDYMKEFALWSKDYFNSYKKAVSHFNELGDSISEKTLYNWANPTKSKKE